MSGQWADSKQVINIKENYKHLTSNEQFRPKEITKIEDSFDLKD